MRITDGIINALRAYARHRRERQTLTAISDLPPHLLKDIGWPGAHDRKHKHFQ
ncbi:MAG TPA: DUF1127 domain-containing protein [Rhizobiaceae bacterium]|nr:DUF1127 domain-containing protein [Rhizobiaceae bacterium]